MATDAFEPGRLDTSHSDEGAHLPRRQQKTTIYRRHYTASEHSHSCFHQQDILDIGSLQHRRTRYRTDTTLSAIPSPKSELQLLVSADIDQSKKPFDRRQPCVSNITHGSTVSCATTILCGTPIRITATGAPIILVVQDLA